MELKGAFTALVTPFKNNQIDQEKFREHIEWQIQQGVNGLVPCGTTGESATMSHEEHKQAIQLCIEQNKGRLPVIAGTGSNNTSEAIELTKYAKEAGADAVLSITPYYNKPTQAGLKAHFKAIAESVSIPTVVYNVPGRTGVNLLPETLADIKKDILEVEGVKEASGNINQVSQVVEYCGSDFNVLAGEDFIVLPLMAQGGRGVISVVSNIVPSKMAGLCSAFLNKDPNRAREQHFDLAPLCRAMFFETNPIPVKTALSMMGRMDLELRLPLVNMQPENEARLREVLEQKQLL